MTNEEKAKGISDIYMPDTGFNRGDLYDAAMQMAQWKDRQHKTAYVVTRSDLHYDEVEKVFFDKEKAEEYCKSFNENENDYCRDITEIEVSL